MAPWISVNDELPPEGKYVLVHLTKDNWIDEGDQDGVYFKTAKLRKGISLQEREEMKRGERPDPNTFGYRFPGGVQQTVTSKRSATHGGEDEYGNNLRPYNWENFGPGDWFGQDVDYWMPIPPVPMPVELMKEY